tara:strand:+ start:4644 stop:6470 length:1827 start_codon:yes stop_codon:yes gene_type:complete
MCGISGFFGKSKILPNNILKTLELMRNRGPNFSDFYENKFDKGLAIYLLHSRLSIIDLQKRSNQPFKIREFVIIFNGEIYNYLELRQSLIEKGIKLKTNSDTEILLNYYILYGEKCVQFFDGMWAFAIFNTKTKNLFLSRDNFGEKPLYFYKNNLGIFFGSETRFIESLSDEIFNINSNKINRFLSFGARCLFKDNKTFYRKILSLRNSENLNVDHNLNIKKNRYWLPKPKIKKYNQDDIFQISQNLLVKSLKRRMRSDVPMAFLLSGGVDSGGLTSLAVKKFKKTINTFSIIDQDTRYNEIKNIKKVVSDLKCKNTTIKISKTNFLNKLKDLINYHNSPVFTLAQFLHSELMAKIQKTGTKVVLSGTGADEIFSGYYDHYLIHLAYLKNKKNNYELNYQYWKKYIKRNIRNPLFKKKDLFLKNPKFRDHVYDNSEILSKNLLNPEKFEFKENNYSNNLFSNRRANELFNETVPAILNNEDLNSMKYSIENRSPFLNKDLFNFIFSIDPIFLIQKGYSKYILRKNLQGFLNDKVRNDRQKKGFNCSINTLLDFKNKSTQDYLLEKNSKIFEFINRKQFKNFLNGDLNKNYSSKFIFSFISAKIFLDKN